MLCPQHDCTSRQEKDRLGTLDWGRGVGAELGKEATGETHDRRSEGTGGHDLVLDASHGGAAAGVCLRLSRLRVMAQAPGDTASPGPLA